LGHLGHLMSSDHFNIKIKNMTVDPVTLGL
jgi:hypothetical protein